MIPSVRHPLITIGVPVYNGERYLPATLDSLLNQTIEDFVILVADNASTDGTADIVRDYAARDSRVHHIRHPRNLGAAVNYNRVFELANTKFFRWSSCDDVSEPRFLEACLPVLERDADAVLVYPRVRLIDGDGHQLRDYDEGLHLPHERASDRFFALLDRIRLCNAVYGLLRRDVVCRTRLMGSFRGSDIVFQAELSLYGKFIEIPEVLFLRRMHEQAYASSPDEQQHQFYRPGRRQGIELRGWRHLGEHLRSVVRAPVSLEERLRLLAGLARRATWGREGLLDEIYVAARALFTSERA